MKIYNFLRSPAVIQVLLALIVIGAVSFKSFASEPAPIATPVPFWAAKPDLIKKMREDRYIAVSAQSENKGDDKHLVVLTGGFIHAPDDFTHQHIMNFDSYSKHMPYMQESAFDTKTQNLFVHGAILGYHVRMTIHIDDVATPEGHQVQWRTIAGQFVGMHGTITDHKSDTEHTQVALEADYLGKTLNIPGFILSWGLEFAAQRACGAMREYIEDDFRAKSH
jgi:uncharacterized membrane protein